MPPTIIFGDIRALSLPEVKPILLKYQITRLDSAAAYENGDSERRLGESGWSKDFTIDTKILTGPLDSGTLMPEKIEESSRLSLERLGVERVNMLYVHAPDLKTPVGEQARAFDAVFREGRFEELGLCNLQPNQVEEWLGIAKEKGYVKPTWFQAVHQSFREIIGMGLESTIAPAWYEAYDKLEVIAEKCGIPTDELSLRWSMHHSALREGDVLILEASKTHQIEKSLANLHKCPLPDDVVSELNSLWTPEMDVEGRDLINVEKWKFG